MFNISKKMSRLCVTAAEESVALLENKNGALPLEKGEKVAVFGIAQLEFMACGTGSGGKVNAPYIRSPLDELSLHGLDVCRSLFDIYTRFGKDKEVKKTKSTSCFCEMPLENTLLKQIASEYGTAIYFISRFAGEDHDMIAGEGGFHLTPEEKAALKAVRNVFNHLIVVINSGNVIDLSYIKSISPEAILFCPQSGMEGARGLARIICGVVSPSARLADTIAIGLDDYPSTVNFGNADKSVYAEDIYVGYRHFETFAKSRVIYPFGYGLSYTDFDITCESAESNGKTVTVNGIVTNIGEYSGKETVQIYLSKPQAKLGAPEKILCGFYKTTTLAPKESKRFKVRFQLSDFASYDDTGVTGECDTFILEKGLYTVYMGKNVRDCFSVMCFEFLEDEIISHCTHILYPTEEYKRTVNSNGIPANESVPMRTFSIVRNHPLRIAKTLPPYNGTPTLDEVKNGTVTMSEFIGSLTFDELSCLIQGEGMSSPKVTAGTGCAFGGISEKLIARHIPAVCGTDGPCGLRLDSGETASLIPCEAALAMTWNANLITSLYEEIGKEMQYYCIDTLLGPSANIHRSPLCGRNFEYPSEDPLICASVACAALKGLEKAGKGGTIKHFAANNQESGRYFGDSVVSARALREIYLFPFEKAIKSGRVHSVMTAYNKINGIGCAGNEELIINLLRGEWGYRELTMTDWWTKANEEGDTSLSRPLALLMRAHNDIYMVTQEALPNESLKKALADGFVTLGEMQACAADICRFIMKTEAYSRAEKKGFKTELLKADTQNSVPVMKVESIVSGHEYCVDQSSGGDYILEFIYTASGNALAQHPIKCTVNGMSAFTAVMSGNTGGKTVTIQRKLGLKAGEKKFVLDFPAQISISCMNIYKL